MASAAVHSKAVVLLLLFIVALAPIVCGGFVLGSCFVVQYFVSFLVLQLSHCGRESWLLYFCGILNCHVSVVILCLFLTVPWVGLYCVIVAFPGQTHYFSEQGPNNPRSSCSFVC